MQNAKTAYNSFSRGGGAIREYTLGLKAARADFDGDGKDELAVFMIHFYDFYQYWENGDSTTERAYPYLARWYCDKGTITPCN